MTRAEWIWAVCHGERPAAAAAAALGVHVSRIYQLRDQAQAAFAAACAPAPRGRPKAPPSHPDTERAAELQRENAELRVALEAARWRTELALLMPEVLGGAPAPPVPPSKKKGPRRRGRGGADGA